MLLWRILAVVAAVPVAISSIASLEAEEVSALVQLAVSGPDREKDREALNTASTILESFGSAAKADGKESAATLFDGLGGFLKELGRLKNEGSESNLAAYRAAEGVLQRLVTKPGGAADLLKTLISSEAGVGPEAVSVAAIAAPVGVASAGGGTVEVAGEASRAKRLLYVGVPSSPGNFCQRDRVRTQYLSALNAAHAKTGLVRAEFIIGHARLEAARRQGNFGTPWQLEEEARLEEESRTFGDVRRIPLPEEYNSLPDKTLQLFAAGVEGNYSFIAKVDDDNLLHVDTVLDFARKTDPDSLVYGGGQLFDKAQWPEQRGPQGDFHQYFSGPGYLLSLALAKRIVRSSHSVEFVGYGSSSEDVDMGLWVASVQENVTFSDVDVSEGDPLPDSLM